MLKRLRILALVMVVPGALAAKTFDGKWRASLSRYEGGIAADFVDGIGSVTFYGPSKWGNPCLGKALPAFVRSVSDAEVLIEVNGISVLRGCFTGTLTLHSGDGGTWVGTLPNGLTSTWTRE